MAVVNPGSFDIIGDIAILEIPEGENEKKLAEGLLKIHKNLKTIYMKEGERAGEFRLRKLRKLWGNGPETIHREHGCVFKMDVTKTYFSPREGTERQRIAGQVKPGEDVLIMFSGIAPYGIAVAKKQPRVGHVYCIEKNKHAHKYAEENVKLNRMKYQVIPVLGDVRKRSKEFYGKMDRIVMPLPGEGYKYLPVAISCLKPGGGTLHFYYISMEKDMFSMPEKILETQAKMMGKKVKILGERKVLPYSPKSWKICLDCRISQDSVVV